ncbi:secondary thiamine-phosphate synthase enzyme YjbQ [Polyangium spumosum]|uniref:YjbQ family protein n=1 Tax=Polyangium spumosum TaxID=889282 RepID=A0A6N7PWW8_9BACT|nr:secondary thiamine-phosphate synthase enzyme YjbQ [Polyangium spumosum]MRG96017.1 YjbQ family protein [Polyangium spumosum]
MNGSIHQKTLDVRTRGRGLYDVTSAVAAVVGDAGASIGLCSLFLQHTSASLVVQENADPAVLRDLDRFMARVAPEGAGYEHDAEGPDDMPAHIRAALTSTSLTIPITAGRLALGTWQAIYVWEHRTSPHTRRLVVTVLGA